MSLAGNFRGFRPALWTLGLVGVMVVLMSAAFVLAEGAGWEDARWWSALLEEGGGREVAAVLVVLLLTGDLFLPVPSSILMTAAGAALGFWLGFTVNAVGSMGCGWVGWGLARTLGRGYFRRRLGEEARWAEAHFERWGPWALVWSRPVPMLSEVIAILSGLYGMSWLRFSVFYAMGAVPLSALYAWAGAAGREASMAMLLGAFAVPGIALGVWSLWKRRSA